MEQEKYPAKEGWIKAKLSIVPGTNLTEDQVLMFCTGSKETHLFEVAEFKHFKTVIRMTFRKIQQ